MTDTATISDTQQPLSNETLELLRAASSWDVVPRPTGKGTFPARIATARRALKQLEHDFALLPQAPSSPSSNSAALLELRANARMMRAAGSGLVNQLHVISRLPRVMLPAQRDEPRAAAAAALYLRAVHG